MAAASPDPRDDAAPSDERLMARVAADDDLVAFETLVARHEASARTFAWRVVRRREDAEEVAQEAFLRVWSHRAAWRPTGSFRGWLLRIVHRLALDRWRRRRARPEDPADDIAMLAGADRSPSPPEALERRRRAERLLRAVDHLPPRHRSAILLFHMDDLSLAEGAEALDISPKAFESLLARARTALRQLLEREPDA